MLLVRVLTPRPYFTADQVGAVRAAAVVTIQRYSRGWLARKKAWGLRGNKSERDAFLAEQAAKQKAEAEEKRR